MQNYIYPAHDQAQRTNRSRFLPNTAAAAEGLQVTWPEGEGVARKACLATCGDRHWFCKRVLFLSWDFVLMRLEERGCRAGWCEGSPRHRRAAKPAAAPRPPRRSGFAMPVSSRRSLNVGEGPPLFRPQPPGTAKAACRGGSSLVERNLLPDLLWTTQIETALQGEGMFGRTTSEDV